MFTGIIETVATVERTEAEGSNIIFHFQTAMAPEFRVDESVAHNGVCLTVEAVEGERYRVTAIAETLVRSMLGDLKAGDRVNLERAMPVGGRLDGHFVQGHVDAVGEVTEIVDRDGSYEITIRYAPEYEELIVEKGSVCLNGISLTVARNNAKNHTLTVAIIPYTWEHTDIQGWRPGSRINVEFDVLGKYVQKIMAVRQG